MSNGMYCSASHWIDSPSSASVIAGRLIFLTMTALPESDAATSFVLNALFENRRLMASATALLSMMAPSTMLSGGTGSEPKATTLYPLPAGLISTALTALDPMSSPTTGFCVLPVSNTAFVLFDKPSQSEWLCLRDVLYRHMFPIASHPPLAAHGAVPYVSLTVLRKARMLWVYRCRGSRPVRARRPSPLTAVFDGLRGWDPGLRLRLVRGNDYVYVRQRKRGGR